MALQKIRKGYILFLLRRFSILVCLVCWCLICNSQTPTKIIYNDTTNHYLLITTTLNNKIIPINYQNCIKTALAFYPELKNTIIIFRVKNKLSPLAAKPTIWSAFMKPEKRKYIVTISEKSNKTLDSILLKHLSFNAQVGVIGHEISHISEYNNNGIIFFIKLIFKHLSKTKIDDFEFNTDKRCIEHGLGYQLLSWSTEVRCKLKLKKWGGANKPNANKERYMNPETITKFINNNLIYK